MPRTERKVSKTDIYHVILRGTNKQLIFEETKDYKKFLACVSEVKEISDFKLFAYCLMGNHVHLLIKTGKEPLSQIFKRIGARYVFWFNWKYGRNGHLFQDRFLSEPVESDEYFIIVLSYIYQNPVKAGLCKLPQDYEWGSRKHLGKGETADENELFNIVPLETILKYEMEEVQEEVLDLKPGRKAAIPDAEALNLLKTIGCVKSVAEFQALDRKTQAQTLKDLCKNGASIRQLARLSGLGKNVVERLCKNRQDA